ncbi:MAG: hypothetical protein BV456_11955 [Thermoplasmata archaeon M8B2D]|nr:MAG: hypothetical protein BV456_11955 [Thermoplasmata archaeon M8B2D]
MKKIFAPGCAFILYRPELVKKLHKLLIKNLEITDMLTLCCRNQPKFDKGSVIINVCPGCDKRYRQNYEDISTISLWEVLAESDVFTFPDYQGKEMSIIDACPTRSEVRVHKAIRSLLDKMNITLIEPEKTGTNSTCCGDNSFGKIPIDKVKMMMTKRASEMPVDDVVVYCVSCTKALFIGGKKPRYMIDLLFGEETVPKTFEPDQWHKELDEYIEDH